MSVPGQREAGQKPATSDSAELSNESTAQDPLPSDFSGVTMSNSSTMLRLYVLLPAAGGQKLLVQVPDTATIQYLKFQVLQRAAKLGTIVELSGTVIKTTGPRAVIIDDCDLVANFIDLTEDSTFSLEVLKAEAMTLRHLKVESYNLPMRPAAATKTASKGDLVFVRLITVEDAIKNSILQHIPTLKDPFSSSTTLHVFHAEIIQLVDNPAWVRLWLKDCPLIGPSNAATLSDLGLVGTPEEPVDIFVQIMNNNKRTDFGQVTDDLWGLNATKRGISTFSTCLDILIQEIRRGNIMITTVLDVLLEVTHFPPALSAFRRLFDTNRALEGSNAVLSDFLLITYVFSLICASMVPDWVCKSAESKLEGCRAVFAWLRTACVHAKHIIPREHVHEVQVFQPPHCAIFGPHETFDLLQKSMSTGESTSTRLMVSLGMPVRGMAKRFVIATKGAMPRSGERWDYFFEHGSKDWKEFLASDALRLPGPTDYDNLLMEANRCPAFIMVDPMQLGSCRSAQLPVITLSAKGYVSKYNERDEACGEREYYQWNLVEGQRDFKGTNPGEILSRELQPVIRERQDVGEWEVDAWAAWADPQSITAGLGNPDEAVVICVDISGSMADSMQRGWNPARDERGEGASRLAEVKEFFNNFSTRLSAYGLSTSVGLVTFSDNHNVNIVQPITALQLDFRDGLNDTEPDGCTAIFDALDKAKDMLVALKAASQKTKCRIVLLTDGDDNCSKKKPKDVCSELYENGIVLDAIVIGTNATGNLFKIARSTGGYAFHPQTQQVFFQVFLLETFVDVRTRPDAETVDFKTLGGWGDFKPKDADMKDQYSFPPCRPHPNQGDCFIALSDARRFWRRKGIRVVENAGVAWSDSMSAVPSISSGSKITSTSSSSSMGTRVFLSEVRAMVENPNPNISVFVSERNVAFWKIVMKGPEGSPYEQGNWLLYCDLGVNFPREPPAVRFITPILHPNISKHGRICHPVFDREWSSNIQVHEVLTQILGMLMTLESRDAIDPISVLKFYTDPVAGNNLVSDYIKHFASRSRAELEAEIVSGNDTSSLATSSYAISGFGTNTSEGTATPSTGTKRSWSLISGGASSLDSGDHKRVRPPPLMATPGSTGALPLTEGNLAVVGGGAPTAGGLGANEAPSGVGGRVSRRAGFFRAVKLAKAKK